MPTPSSPRLILAHGASGKAAYQVAVAGEVSFAEAFQRADGLTPAP